MNAGAIVSSLRNRPIISTSALVAVLCLGAGYWRSTVAAEAQARLNDREAEANRLADNIRNGQKLDAQLTELTGVNQKIRLQLVDPADVATNQQYFYKLESDTGTKLLELRQGTTIKGKSGQSFSSIPYAVTVQGEYLQILSFLRRLESGSRFCRINAANVAVREWYEGPGGSTPVLTMSVNLEFLGI